MNLKYAVEQRILALCSEHNFNPNSLAVHCGIDPSTIYSILGVKSKNPSITTIKKICDGFDITLGEFFSSPEFDALEQEIE